MFRCQDLNRANPRNAVGLGGVIKRYSGQPPDQLMRAMELDELAAEQDELADALEDMLDPDPNAAEIDLAGLPLADPADLEEWKKAQDARSTYLAK